ncbi:sensor histidine kinase [Solidesulfovibrio sp. C21]|uniref:sensor histidine kinase n=1 Tax=Solidesulfovibrio sp. C21 TaxID=3398613 RepID=UPI0039FCDD74
MNAGVVPFLPAQRTSVEELGRQAQLFASSPAAGVLNRLPLGVAVCNATRQIIYSNEKFRELASLDCPDKNVLGQRLGEALSCLGANIEIGGCGTSETCRGCGVARSMAKLLAGATEVQGECSLARHGGKRLETLDFRLWAWGMPYDGEVFHAIILTDTRAEKRLSLIERIFYHDILNIVSGMQGICEIMREEEEGARNAELDLLIFATERINDLIVSQREFTQAEHGDYEVTVSKLGTRTLLGDIVAFMRRESSARGKTLVVAKESADAFFATDRRLLSRILVNMQKNALEASGQGDTITVGCALDDGHVRFWVHNPGVVPEEARAQIFRRAFSTKGAGRGLGTYGMKLFAEKYLGGEVGFASDATAGTTFFVRLPLDI